MKISFVVNYLFKKFAISEHAIFQLHLCNIIEANKRTIMAPIYVKGGLWSNVEDEILKAAVSKYGVNQWSRVASLLTKKSAKQAKARWFEWLNPNINKLEWTRQEDEKLLNLVKVLPNQWRTVAPIMGRTATHCAERYQKLIDDVMEGEDELKEFGIMGPGMESLPSTGNQVGDLNFNPEGMPAIPDEEDMDDEQREMLTEAKARLANTQGKKAKRKARERMLQESRRLALLQKRREFKAAGINVSLKLKNKNQRNEFDYNADIPHEHLPMVGLHDVTEEEEIARVEKAKFNKTINKEGITLYYKKEKKEEDKKNRQASQKRQLGIEAAAELVNEYEVDKLKKRKLNLPDFDEEHVLVDLDRNIEESAKELKLRGKGKSSVLVGLPEEANEVEEKQQVASPQVALSKKQIFKLFQLSIKTLAVPKQEMGVILPSFDPNEESINLHVETSQDDRWQSLELLRQVEQEQAKLRRSQVVQRGLTIPNPEKLKKITNESNELTNLISQEYQQLIKSDYRKYVDQSYKAKLLEDLDESTYEQVNLEIQREMGNISKPEISFDYKLPDTFDIAETIITKLHEYHKASTTKHETINHHLQEVYLQEQELVDKIADNYSQMADLNHSITSTQSILQQEETNMNVYTNQLRKSVDQILEAERNAKNQLREIQLKTK